MQEDSLSLADADKLIEELIHHPNSASVSTADQAMLDFALKLTKATQPMQQSDADSLRDAGFSDLAIHDIVCCISYFAFVNRVADGLGIELESTD